VDRKFFCLVYGDPGAIQIAADTPAFNQQAAAKHSATEGNASACINPVSVETWQDRAIKNKAIDDRGTQDRRRIEPTFLQADVTWNTTSFKVKYTGDPGALHTDAFLMRARAFFATKQQESQELSANSPCLILNLRQGSRRFMAQPVEITAAKCGDDLLLSWE
jgi:hypothetical protein